MKRRHGVDQTASELIQRVDYALREPDISREAVLPAVEVLARLRPEEAVRILDSGALDEEILRVASAEEPAAVERFDQARPFSYDQWLNRTRVAAS